MAKKEQQRRNIRDKEDKKLPKIKLIIPHCHNSLYFTTREAKCNAI